MNIKNILFIITFFGYSLVSAQSTNLVNEVLNGSEGSSAFLSPDSGGFTDVYFLDSDLQGGNGGTSSSASLTEVNVNAGHGYEDQGLPLINDFVSSDFIGGNGGGATNSQGAVTAFGGDGVNIIRGDLTFANDLNPSTVSISSGTFTGGSGGTVSLYSTSTSDPSIYEQTFLNIPGAHGGHGFRFTRLDQSTPSFYYGATQDDTITVSEGTFIGGSGGTVINSEDGLISAQGGSGFFVDYADVVINGGTFSGGAAGTSNGILDRVGAGLHAQDANLIINGGVFNTNGLGLRVENRYYDTVNTINNGSFGEIEYISNYDDYTPTIDPTFDGSNRTTRANIYDGSISSISLSGVTFNDINIFGGSVDTIIFSSNASGSDRVSINSSANVGEIKILTQANNIVNFENDILPVGTSLDLGLGTLYSTNLSTQTGNQIQSTFSANNGSSIPNTGILSGENITLSSGTTWQLENDSSSPFENFQELSNTNGFLLVSTTGTITNNMIASDVSLAGNTEWLLGITGLEVITNGSIENLYASYGLGQLNEILNASGDLLIVANELQPAIQSNDDLRLYIQSQYSSSEELTVGLSESFLRTPEVVNASFDVQSKISDQIRMRQKQFRRFNYFGNAVTPKGPSGWISDTRDYLGKFFPSDEEEEAEFNRFKEQIDNRYEYLPNVKINETLKNAERTIPESRQFKKNLDQISERFSKEDIKDEIIPVRKAYASGYVGKGKAYNAVVRWLDNITPDFTLDKFIIPNNYQAWGRGYITDVNRDNLSNHAGYNARINGAMFGFDRKNDQFILGFSGGLAETSLDGNNDNDADMTSLHIGSYLSIFSEKLFFDANMNYTWNYIDTFSPTSTGYSSDFEGNNLSFSINSGWNLNFQDKLFISPEISHLSSLFSRDAYSEISSISGLPTKNYNTYDQWSHQTELGMTLMLLELIDHPRLEMIFRPEMRLFWLHTHNPELDSQLYTFQNNLNTVNNTLLPLEEDLFKIGFGVNFWDLNKYNTEFSLDMDYLKGSELKEYTFSGSFIHRF